MSYTAMPMTEEDVRSLEDLAQHVAKQSMDATRRARELIDPAMIFAFSIKCTELMVIAQATIMLNDLGLKDAEMGLYKTTVKNLATYVQERTAADGDSAGIPDISWLNALVQRGIDKKMAGRS